MEIGVIGRSEPIIKGLLKKYNPKKLYFIVEKEKVHSIIPIRNKISITFSIPSEICWEAKGDAIFCLEPTPFSFSIAAQCIIKGIPFYYFNTHDFVALPVIKGGLPSLFSPIQVDILKALTKPLSFEELSQIVNIPAQHLYYYLYGRNSLKGLVNLGLVEMKNGKYMVSELGKKLTEM